MKFPKAEGTAGITNRKIMIAPCSVKARLYICWGVSCVSVMLSLATSAAELSVMIVGPGRVSSVRIISAKSRTEEQTSRPPRPGT